MKLMTEISHLWNKNLPVTITEYLDGEAFWFAVDYEDDEYNEFDYEFDYRKDQAYLLDDQVVGLLEGLVAAYGPCTIQGKVCGPDYGVNDYGFEDPTMVLTSIATDIPDWTPLTTLKVHEWATMYNFYTPPVIYSGVFSRCQIGQHLDRPSMMTPASRIKTDFKVRCGTVFTPQTPEFNEELDNWLQGWQPSIAYADLKGIDHGISIDSDFEEEARS